ncbi:SDR family oxidoreductase [Pusillimonas sp. CC-YST705]|uniref:SDR family oxidoreductase n=1 Tax=Mesopusillimonas faecipullorum TaxID=2755040 RepID=A0ABS8CAR6_9BURK|nr:SDR family oxidoreductase [Mesopusillimonas faecipullorum]MCB5363134.1 SDR family oxidoreductase [Mesopusillimonas faecipullorum]
MNANTQASNSANLLKGRRVLVTGAARGLGLEFARSLLQAGAQVALADILARDLHAAVADLRAQGLPAYAIEFDMNDPASIEACAQSAVRQMGGLDGLVNNAAMTHSGGKTLHELDVAVWDQVMNINVRGTWLMTRACHAALSESGRGAVVNLASDTPLWGAPKLLAYVASKGAIIAMSRTLAREMGADNITVNTIAPGLTLVEATEYVPRERHELYQNQRALQRAQLPDDVSGAILFLLSDLSRFMTGQLLAVNGGFVMH